MRPWDRGDACAGPGEEPESTHDEEQTVGPGWAMRSRPGPAHLTEDLHLFPWSDGKLWGPLPRPGSIF